MPAIMDAWFFSSEKKVQFGNIDPIVLSDASFATKHDEKRSAAC